MCYDICVGNSWFDLGFVFSSKLLNEIGISQAFLMIKEWGKDIQVC